VDISRLPDRESPGPHFAMGANAYDSSRAIGERMVEDEVRWLGAKAAEMLQEYRSSALTERRPLSFLQVEQIWRDEVEPILPEFKSMQMQRDNRPEGPSPESRWMLNWKI
jgi:hypothetical protein